VSASDFGAARARPAAVPGRRGIVWERDIRLATGVVLLVFVTTHLVNHALGIFGLAALNAMQDWRWDMWHEQPGASLLYGSFAVHSALGLKRIVARRTWRMPLEEAAQIVLALLIPLFLVQHFVSTRLLNDFFDAHEYYDQVLARMWPRAGLSQTALVIVVWTHAAIGMHFALRVKPWWRKWRGAALVFAVLVPMLALSGFVSAAREVAALPQPAEALTPEQIAGLTKLLERAQFGLQIGFGLLAALVALRAALLLRRRQIKVTYAGHGEFSVAPGLSLLEASRLNKIPHPAICGGRARCSTCRVLVTAGAETLPAPEAAEAALLHSISAAPRVRLACQLRPKHDIAVQILLPAIGRDYRSASEAESYKWGVETEVTVLFVDLRAFSTLAQSQQPYETVVVLNRFIAEMTQAVEAHEGKVDLLLSDGLMAVFGMQGRREAGARSAILGARAMLRAMRVLNREFRSALPLPLRIGIGIHTGKVVLAEVGETVSIASRLQEATKEALTDCLMSGETAAAAGLTSQMRARQEIQVQGRAAPITAFALPEKEIAVAAA
jgi:adenylate cyclase